MKRTIALLLSLMALGPAQAIAQQGCPLRGDSTSSMGGPGAMMGMMADHGLMARLDSLDVRLDSLAKIMTRATGTRRRNAMSDLLGALVAQHLGMRRLMHEQMMAHMDGSGMGGNASRGNGMEGSACATPVAPDSGASNVPMHQH